MPHCTTSRLTDCGSRNHSECAHSSHPHTPTIATIATILTTSRKVSPRLRAWSGGTVIGLIAAIWKTSMIKAAPRDETRPLRRGLSNLHNAIRVATNIRIGRAPDSRRARGARKSSMNELADKVAIITGGGYGIGKLIALKYGARGREGGARGALHRSDEADLRRAGKNRRQGDLRADATSRKKPIAKR